MPIEGVGTRHSRRDMFRAELRLIEYPGKVLKGKYSRTLREKGKENISRVSRASRYSTFGVECQVSCC